MPEEIKKETPNKRSKYLLPFLTLLILLAGLGVAVFLIQQPQIFKKFAAEQGTCSWTCQNDCPSTFSVTITNLTTQEIIFDDLVEGNSVSFDAEDKHEYDCSVSAENSCGVAESSATQTCGVAETPTPTLPTTPTPSVTLTITPSLTPSETPTETPTETPPLTPPLTPPTATPSATGSPTPTLAITHKACRYSQCLVLPGPASPDEQTCGTYLDCIAPTTSPTVPPDVTLTLTPQISPSATPTLAPGITPTKTPVPTSTPIPTATPTPLAEDLPESGISWPTYVLIIVSLLFITGGALLTKI